MVFVPAAASMDDSVSSVNAETNIIKVLDNTGLINKGINIFPHTAKTLLPDAAAASSNAG